MIVVTGAGPNGFLGHHVRKEFKSRDLKEKVKFVGSEFDLTNSDRARELFSLYRPSIFIHMAAVCGGILANKMSPATFLHANTAMNLNVYECARDFECSRVYTLGSVCSYPKFCPVPFKEDNLFNGFPEETNAPYGLAKRHLYMMGKTYREQFNIRGAHLIPVNLFGEKDHFDLTNSHVIPALINKFLDPKNIASKKVHCWGTGAATREFVYAGDVARAIVDVAIQNLDIEDPINIGTGQDISIKDLAHLIGKLTNFDGDIIFTGEVSDGQPKRRLDVSRAKEVLGFEAKVSLEEGLKKTIKWYKENG